MPTRSQTASGKSLEYALATALNGLTGAPIYDNSAANVAHRAFHASAERTLLVKVAYEVARFLVTRDQRLRHAQCIKLQTDQQGQSGDVRDIVVELDTGELEMLAVVFSFA